LWSTNPRNPIEQKKCFLSPTRGDRQVGLQGQVKRDGTCFIATAQSWVTQTVGKMASRKLSSYLLPPEKEKNEMLTETFCVPDYNTTAVEDH